MKKLKNIFATLTIASSLFFTSCYNAVFYEVMRDVVSEDADVSGSINQITRYTVGGSEYLVCNADGGLRYKLADKDHRSHGEWATYKHLPFELHYYDYYGTKHHGEQIIQVLADETNLYLLTCEYFDDDDEGTVSPKYVKLWTAAISSWDTADTWKVIQKSESEVAKEVLKVYKNSSSGYYYSAFCVFSTNTINPANRRAYVRSGKNNIWYYRSSNINEDELKETSFYEMTPDGLNPITIEKYWDSGSEKTYDSSVDIRSATWYGGDVHFFTAPAVATNEHYTKMTYTNLDANTTYKEPTHIYWGNGSTLYSVNLENTSDVKTISTSRNISSLAVCADSIIIGMGNTSAYSTSSYGGITRSPLDATGKPTGTKDFSTNAESQISSGYIVFSLLNTDPSEPELDSAIYATIGFYGSGSSTATSYSSIGMWSYYPERGNWNRE